MPVIPRVFLICASLSAMATAALAQGPGPLVTDRPDQTESASVVGVKYIQLELGWLLTEEAGADLRVRRHAVPGLLVRIGVLARRLEARLGFAGWMRTHNQPAADSGFVRSGVGDLDVGLKVRLLDAVGARPDVALIGTLNLPTGDAAFSRLRADPTLLVAFASELSPVAGVGYNIGAEWSTGCDPAVADACVEVITVYLPYTLAFGFAVGERVGVFLESFGALPVGDTEVARHSLDGGLTLRVRDNLQLDVSGGIGLNGAAEDWLVGAGVALRLPR